jgi:hypothetical protein
MSLVELPASVTLHSEKPVALSISKGQAVVKGPLQFPEFYLKTNDLPETLLLAAADTPCGRWPAVISNGVLSTDPAWGVFGWFFEYPDDGPGLKVVESIASGKVDWKLSCPVNIGHESVIGLLMASYGKHSCADPGCTDYNPTHVMRQHPIEKILSRAARGDLVEFEDRGSTLLDLAITYQLWPLADWLWNKGVRWSENALATGQPLEGLIIATRALQGSLATGFLDDFKVPEAGGKRIEWVSKWLKRWEETGAPASHVPSLTWRSRRAEKHGWQGGIGVRDTPASMWACMFIDVAGPRVLEFSRAQEHAKGLIACWAQFWARQGVDMEIQPIQKNNETSIMGIREFWGSARNAEGWIEYVRTQQQAACMEMATCKSNGVSRSGPRL